ncbi:MAG: response regulator [Candidatus Aenigmarchaeota archaeon]|nr:response regulator [Candidatus Aenigmarchaeota archaeon]
MSILKKLLVVDGHYGIRKGLVLRFEGSEKFLVVGEAENGEKALKKVKDLDPDVVILDFSMPRENGLKVASKISKISSQVKIVLCSLYDLEEIGLTGKDLLEYNIAGYIPKLELNEESLINLLESLVTIS